jgi:predicted Zn-dependent peptidase
MLLREKNGLAYNVESNYSTYSDIGIINIYFGTDKENIDKCKDLIRKELKKLREIKLGTIQLTRAKRQLIGQVAMAAENNENQMISNGRSILLFNRVDTLEELRDKINKITANELLEVMNEIFEPNNLSELIFF